MLSPLRFFLPIAVATTVLAAPAVAHADTVWLCRPGADPNACRGSLKTTVKMFGEPKKVVTPKLPRKPKIDCFYVYPTVSEQTTPIANLDIEPAQTSIANYQAARFSQVCNVYAPMYRQVTLRAILSGGSATVTPEEREAGYTDVLNAWNEFRAEKPRRGFVLIGHSQGSGVLKRLIREQIDPDPQVREKMVSALLIGSSVAVPTGKRKGGDFSNTPICTGKNQVGCVISYASFGEKPPTDSLFGRVRVAPQPDVQYEAACTNPAALKGGWAKIDTLVRGKPIPGLLGAAAGILYGGTPPKAKTAWLTPKDRYRAKCMTKNGANVLMVKPVGKKSKKLIGSPNPGWGLHLMDINLPLGDLIDLVRSQKKAYAKR
jgi:hypothetical protein